MKDRRMTYDFAYPQGFADSHSFQSLRTFTVAELFGSHTNKQRVFGVSPFTWWSFIITSFELLMRERDYLFISPLLPGSEQTQYQLRLGGYLDNED